MSAYLGWSQLIKVEQVKIQSYSIFFFLSLVDDDKVGGVWHGLHECMIRLVNNSCHHLSYYTPILANERKVHRLKSQRLVRR